MAEGPKTLRDPLRVVEPVDGQNQPTTDVASVKVVDPLGDARVRRDESLPFIGHDPDRVRLEADDPAADVDLVHPALHPQDLEEAPPEGTHVFVRLEADDIGTEEPLEDRLALGQDPEDLRWRERDVQEETAAHGRLRRPQQSGEEHELVVLDPDEIVGARPVDDRSGEPFVGVSIRVPGLRVEPDQGREAVEQRPERVVAVPLVERPADTGGQFDGREPVLPLPLLEQFGSSGRIARACVTGPADPEAIGLFQNRPHGGDQPAAAPLTMPPTPGSTGGQWQSVRNDDDAISHDPSIGPDRASRRIPPRDDRRAPLSPRSRSPA